LAIRIEQVAAVERTANGKTRLVVSRVPMRMWPESATTTDRSASEAG
jgi:hypothetical protein